MNLNNIDMNEETYLEIIFMKTAKLFETSAEIGSILSGDNKEQSKVPVIVDAGVGTASDATIAMELGCDGVLINTAIATADDPILMAESMKHAVIAGRKAYKAGRMKAKKYGSASSPLNNLI